MRIILISSEELLCTVNNYFNAIMMTMTGRGGGVYQIMIFDDKGGRGVQSTPKIDDIISEQPLIKFIEVRYYKEKNLIQFSNFVIWNEHIAFLRVLDFLFTTLFYLYLDTYLLHYVSHLRILWKQVCILFSNVFRAKLHSWKP